MLSDPRTFSALVAGLIGDEPVSAPEPIRTPRRTATFEGNLAPDQLSRLLTLGLTDRDLDFMGPRQRDMVMDILHNSTKKSAAA